MIKELVHDDAILSQPCEPATAEDASLAQDLLDTMEATEDAACLAANQIGVAKALVVFADDEGRTHVMYNPSCCSASAPTSAPSAASRTTTTSR